MKKMLIVYYSWSNGNTKRIAEQLANETGADIARIETTEPYKGTHEDVVNQGKRPSGNTGVRYYRVDRTDKGRYTQITIRLTLKSMQKWYHQ